MRHAEVLESDGALHTRSLRSAKATDVYTLADDGEVELEPSSPFTDSGTPKSRAKQNWFRGDRRHQLATSPGADLRVLGASLNKLHENVVWSQRGNFVSVPSDCPQRDERLGWTGDAQAFAPTACTLFESEQFWASWLEDLALDQDDVLGVPSVVPDVVLDGEARFGRAGWADAATFVPWAVYESYGDTEILRRQFESMSVGWIH